MLCKNIVFFFCERSSSCKIVLATGFYYWLQLVTECTDWCWLHSLVYLLQQLVTECTGWYWLHSLLHLLQQLVTVYRLVLATQPCTLASTAGYRMYRLVLATQPCTLASTTGYRVYRLVLATQSCKIASTYRLQSLLTGCWLHSPYCTVLHPNWL